MRKAKSRHLAVRKTVSVLMAQTKEKAQGLRTASTEAES